MIVALLCAAAVHVTSAGEAEDLDVAALRQEQRWAVYAEAAWNGLAGLGVVGSWNASPRLGLDAGVGRVLSGWKGGARARFMLGQGEWAPFVALGAVASSGLPRDETIRGSSGDFSFHVGPAAWAQGVAGFDAMLARHLRMRLELGWAQALMTRDLHVTRGQPDDASWREVRAITSGGLVLGTAIGAAF